MSVKRLTEKEIRELTKALPSEKTPHSIRGISVSSRVVKRDAATGKFVILPAQPVSM